MSKRGVNLKIDVSKIDKTRLFKGQKGTYLDATVFIDDEPDQYGQHGMITQDVGKEERDNGTRGAILGNAKIFWRDEAAPSQDAGSPPPPASGNADSFDDGDIPF